MKKLLLAAIIAFLLSVPKQASAQVIQYVRYLGVAASDPGGSCTNSFHYFNSSTFRMRCCLNSAWADCSIAVTANRIVLGSGSGTTSDSTLSYASSTLNATKLNITSTSTFSDTVTVNSPSAFGFHTSVDGTYTGSGASFVGLFEGVARSSGTNGWNGGNANFGNFTYASGVTAGDNVGTYTFSQLSTGKNYGFIAKARPLSAVLGVGAVGMSSDEGTTNVGLAGLIRSNSFTEPTWSSAALFADNGGTSAPVALLRVNNVTKFTVDSSGNLQETGSAQLGSVAVTGSSVLTGVRSDGVVTSTFGLTAGNTLTPTASVHNCNCTSGTDCAFTVDESGAHDGQHLSILVTSANSCTVTYGSGTVRLSGSVDFTMSTGSAVDLVYDSTASAWCEVGRSDARSFYSSVFAMPVAGLISAGAASNTAGYKVPLGQTLILTQATWVTQVAGSAGTSAYIFAATDGISTCTFTGPACNTAADVQSVTPSGTCIFPPGAKVVAGWSAVSDCGTPPTIGGNIQFLGGLR